MSRRRKLEEEIVDELAFHLEMSASEHESGGLDPMEARDTALREFGDVDHVVAQCLHAAESRPTSIILHHLRVSVPIGIGLGLGLAVLLVAYTVLVRPPATYHDDQAWVGIWWENEFSGERSSDSSLREYFTWLDSNRVFSDMAVARYRPIVFEHEQTTQRLFAKYISPGYLDKHGVEPYLGRNFIDHKPMINGLPGVLISYDFWAEHFESDTGVIGERVSINGRQFVISGVAPEDFKMYYETQIWLPYDFTSIDDLTRPSHLVSGLLREGQTLDDAREDLAGLTPRRIRTDGTYEPGWRVTPRDANSIYLNRKANLVRVFALAAFMFAVGLLMLLLRQSRSDTSLTVAAVVAVSVLMVCRDWIAAAILGDAAQRFTFGLGLLPVTVLASTLVIWMAVRLLPKPF